MIVPSIILVRSSLRGTMEPNLETGSFFTNLVGLDHRPKPNAIGNQVTPQCEIIEPTPRLGKPMIKSCKPNSK